MTLKSALQSRNGLVRQMVKGAAGPLTSALPLFALPLVGAAMLPTQQFAIWSILASISTLALSLDFGGPAYLASRLDPRNRKRPFVAATAMSCLGTAAVSLLSICAWVPFSRTDAGSAFTFLAGVGAIATITGGSALRSVVQLQAQMALFDGRFALRNTILVTHAVTALTVAVGVLLAERTAWALPIAWLAAGLTGVLVGAIAFRAPHHPVHTDWKVETSMVASGGTYVWARTVAVVFRGTLMQADRWIVGAIGGPAALAVYEVAWRVAALPRFLAENLTVIVGLDAARIQASSPHDIMVRVYYSIKFTLAVITVGSIGALMFYALLPAVAGIEISWPTLLLLLVAHGAFAIAAPISFVGNGIGLPKIDLPSLALSVSLSIVGAFISHYTGEVYLFVGAMAVAILVGNLWLVSYGLKVIRGASRRPTASAG